MKKLWVGYDLAKKGESGEFKKAEIPTFKITKSSDGLDYANPENLGNLIYPQFSPP